ncbi:MAG: hypothetical protein LBP19_10380 [Treponema sp.]|nr:hypothetical protein [Treponema sp.]
MKKCGQEARQQEVYMRENPDSLEAYYDKELPDGTIDVCAVFNGVRFVWDRRESNENLERNFFTHYLTRRMYCGDDRGVSNGQKIGKDILTIPDTEKDREGSLCLCSLDMAVLGNPDGDEAQTPPVFIIRRQADGDNRIRLITAYPADDKTCIRLYWKYFFFRAMDDHSQRLDRVATEEHAAFRARLTLSKEAEAEWKRDREARREIFNEVLDEAVVESIAAAKEFTELVKHRAPPASGTCQPRAKPPRQNLRQYRQNL